MGFAKKLPYELIYAMDIDQKALNTLCLIFLVWK